MNNRVFTLAMFLVLAFARGSAQSPTVIKMVQLEKILNAQNDTTYVVNFWATWCIPCVKEFPAFQTLAQTHLKEKMKVVMISLDFKKESEKSLMPFIQKHHIDGAVYLLDEPDYNFWINKIDPDWQGEIPVTLIINNNRKIRKFFANDFNSESLEKSFLQTIK